MSGGPRSRKLTVAIRAKQHSGRDCSLAWKGAGCLLGSQLPPKRYAASELGPFPTAGGSASQDLTCRRHAVLVVHSGHVSDVAVDARVDKRGRSEPQAPRTFAVVTREWGLGESRE